MSTHDNNLSERDLHENNEQLDVSQDADFMPSAAPENLDSNLNSNNENSHDPMVLQQKIAELEAEITDVKARSNADMYNFQKRVERETDNAKKYALDKFSTSLLDVVDNLERALQAAGDEENPVIEGVRLTHKSLLTTLEKHGVTVVDPLGTPFNADQHEAVGIDPNTPAGEVANVLQKGYVLNGRLLRPAMVIVGQ